MAAAHKGAISFGLVHIPVQLYKTTRDTDISFHQLCKQTLERVRYRIAVIVIQNLKAAILSKAMNMIKINM